VMKAEVSQPGHKNSSHGTMHSLADVLAHVPGVHWKQPELNRFHNDVSSHAAEHHPFAIAVGGRSKAMQVETSIVQKPRPSPKAKQALLQKSREAAKAKHKKTIEMSKYKIKNDKGAKHKVNPLNIQGDQSALGKHSSSRHPTNLVRSLALLVLGIIAAQLVALILWYFVGPEGDEFETETGREKVDGVDITCARQLRGGGTMQRRKEGGEYRPKRSNVSITSPWMALSDSLHMYVHYGDI